MMLVSSRPTDPLTGVRLVIVDGTNLLHALAADRGLPGAQPATALVGRLRAVIPAPVSVEIVLDGSPDRGLATRRLVAGLTVRYAGSRSADAVITGLVDTAARTTGGRPAILVVTDDRGLAADARRRGATTTGSAWLLGRLSRTRLAAPSVGVARKSVPRSVAPGPDDDARPAWRPGRGATRKHGNPKRPRRGGPATMRP
jgi:hypothetical protein